MAYMLWKHTCYFLRYIAKSMKLRFIIFICNSWFSCLVRSWSLTKKCLSIVSRGREIERVLWALHKLHTRLYLGECFYRNVTEFNKFRICLFVIFTKVVYYLIFSVSNVCKTNPLLLIEIIMYKLLFLVLFEILKEYLWGCVVNITRRYYK